MLSTLLISLLKDAIEGVSPSQQTDSYSLQTAILLDDCQCGRRRVWRPPTLKFLKLEVSAEVACATQA